MKGEGTGATPGTWLHHPCSKLQCVTIALLILLAVVLRHARAQEAASDSGLTAHEWGTFTSIAGKDGAAMDWLPLTGSTDLPNFVERFRGAQFKGGLRGTVRMETPVLYFYAPWETNVSVNVSFAKGLITEWYPHARCANPSGSTTRLSLYDGRSRGSIAWSSVQVEPGGSTDFPRDGTENRYYVARETSAAPLAVGAGARQQREKFLFYRGVSAMTVPVSAKLMTNGDVFVQDWFGEEIPMLILFERRGENAGYQIVGPLRDRGTFALPELSGSVDALFSELEGILISQGLYADEARAMIETWKTSWFEEGARLFYIVPRGFVDSILPMRIIPAPAEMVRVFVGRVELLTPATERAVESAFAENDQATLAKYGRFLEPIVRTMIQETAEPSKRRMLEDDLGSVYNGPFRPAQE